MRLRVLTSGPLETNAYLLTNPETRQAVLIDAPQAVVPRVDRALRDEGCELVALLLTHGHFDHMYEAAVFQKRGVPVYAHETDRVLLETPQVMEAVVPGLSLTPVNLDRSVSDGDVLNLMGLRIEVRHVPGHCPGNVLFYVEARRAAFVGDVIFAGSVGRTDFPGGDPAVLRNSILKRVYTLPPATVLYPGHGPKTSVEHEFRTNPYVRG